MTLKNTEKGDMRKPIAPAAAIGELPVTPATDAALSTATEWEDNSALRSPYHQIEPLGLAFSGTPTDALTRVRTIGKIDEYSSLLKVDETIIRAVEAKALTKLGVGEAKVMKAAVQAFTAVNSAGEANPRYKVYLNTADFARARGFDIVGRQMPTAEEQEAEAKRVRDNTKNFLRKVRGELYNLRRNASFTWTETIKGRTQAYGEISFIGAYKVDKQFIMIEFVPSAAEYLVKLPLRPEPKQLYLVKDTMPNAYAIGVKLNQHFSIDNNVAKGTEDIISVASLLAVTSIPPIEKVRRDIKENKSNRTWDDRIKDTFEKALDELTRVGFLKDWKYSYSKKRILTDEEASAITDYEQFADLYLYFVIDGYPPHGTRRKVIAEKKEENKRRAAAGKKRKSKDKAEGGE